MSGDQMRLSMRIREVPAGEEARGGRESEGLWILTGFFSRGDV